MMSVSLRESLSHCLHTGRCLNNGAPVPTAPFFRRSARQSHICGVVESVVAKLRSELTPPLGPSAACPLMQGRRPPKIQGRRPPENLLRSNKSQTEYRSSAARGQRRQYIGIPTPHSSAQAI